MTECPFKFCRGQAGKLYTLRHFSVYECDKCGLRFRLPLPLAAETEAMYTDQAYHDSAYFSGQRQGHTGPETRIYADGLDRLDTTVPPTDPGRRLLDVGCGTGMFLEMASGRGWQGEGIELSPQMARLAADRTRATVGCGDFLDVQPAHQNYHAITMWDLLEHVHDPESVLAKARTLLAPGGSLIVFTINSASLFNRIGHTLHSLSRGGLKQPLELLYDARHNYYFTARSLGSLITNCALEVTGRSSYRAYLGRWLSEPAPWWIRLGGDLVDLASVATASHYRQLLYCKAA